MSVSRIAAWQEVVDWGGDGLSYSPPSGDRRCVVICVGAEENNTGGAGIGITSMTLGGQSMVEQREAIVGASSAYHNYNSIWTLNEAGIASMSGSTLTPTWEQGDGIGPFGEVGNHSAFMMYATFQDVDQANIKSAEGGNTNTSTGSLALSATMNVAVDELVIVSNVSGQHYALGTSAGGLVEQIEQVGITNDMSLAVYERTALTADASYTCTMTVATATRMNIQAIALGFDEGVTPIVELPGEETLALTGQAPSADEEHFSNPAIDDLVLAGQVPIITVNHIMLPAVRALVLAGQAPSVERDFFIDVAIETLVLAGQVPTLFLQFARGPPVEELDLTGQAPTVEISVVRAVPVGELDLTGDAPTVERDFFIDVTDIALTLSGQAPVVMLTHSADPAVRALVLDGKVPAAVSTTSALPAEETLVLAGQAPIVMLTHSAAPAIDALVLAGQAPAAMVTHSAAPAADTLVLDGKAFDVLVPITVTPAAGSLAIDGQAPAVTGVVVLIEVPYVELNLRMQRGLRLRGHGPIIIVADSVAPAAETLALSGQAPTLPISIIAPVGALVLDGKAPDVSSAGERSPAAETLVLAGQAPSVERDYFIDVAEATLALAGHIPSIAAADTRAPADVALVLSGQAPTATVNTSIVTPSDRVNAITGSRRCNTTTTYFAGIVGFADISAATSIYGAGFDAWRHENGGIISGITRRTLTEAPFDVFRNGREDWAWFILENVDATIAGILIDDVPGGFVHEATFTWATHSWVTDSGSGQTYYEDLGTGPNGGELALLGISAVGTSSGDGEDGNQIIPIWAPTGSPTNTDTVIIHHIQWEPGRGSLNHTPILTVATSETASLIQLIGHAPTITVLRIVVPAAATLTLDGQAPEVEGAGARTPGAGSLALAGHVPESVTPIEIVPAAETLTLAGQIPLAGQLVQVTPAIDDLVLAGQAPTLSLATIITPAAATLALTGQAPSVERDFFIDIAAGSLALSGKIPLAVDASTEVVSPEAGELRLTVFRGLQLFGYPPTLIVPVDHFAEPPAGELVIFGVQIVNDPVITPEPTLLVLESTSFDVVTQPPVDILVPEATLSFDGKSVERGRGLLFAGHEPNIALSTPQVATGSLALTGSSLNIFNTTIPAVKIEVGTRALVTGSTRPALAEGQEVELSSLILEGWAADVTASSPVFFPPALPLVLSQLVIETDHEITPLQPEDSLELIGSGITLTLSDNHFVAIAATALTLTGEDVTLFANTQLMQPGVTALTLTPQLPTRGGSITPEALAVEFTGQSLLALEGADLEMLPGAGNLALSGQAPVVNVGKTVAPPAGALTLTGSAVLSAAATRALILTGYLPEVTNTLSTVVPIAELTLIGAAPTMIIQRVRRSGARTKLHTMTVERRVESINR